MYKYAQIINDKVHWIMEHEANLKELYEKNFSKEIVFVDISNRPDVQEGWLFDGINFIEPTQSVQSTEEELRQQALNVIYEARQKVFDDTQWIFMRQVTGTAEQKLTDEEYQKYVDYWAEWRDFPDACEDIFNPIYPILK